MTLQLSIILAVIFIILIIILIIHRDIDSYKKQMSEKPWNPLTLDWIKAYENGSYTHYAEPRHATEAIASEAQRMIREHAELSATAEVASENPLFLYVAFTAAHSPLQPDPLHAEKCRHIPHLWRRQFCGMVVGVDGEISVFVISDLFPYI